MLICKCGGSVEVIDSKYIKDFAVERYKCQICDRTGKLIIDAKLNSNRKSGCLTTTKN